MKKFKMLVLLIFLFIPTMAFSAFTSQEDVSLWMMHYYKNPEPEKVPEAIKFLSKSNLLANNAVPPTFGFLSGIFQANPEKSQFLIEELSRIDEAHLGAVVLGVWYANLPDSQVRAYAILEKHPKLKEDFSFLYKGSSMSLEQIPLEQGPWVLDALWGKFMATGQEEPVIRIISALPWINVKGDINRLLVGGAARWSLTSNAVQHQRVLEICEAEIKTQPKEIAEILREVVGQAKKELSTGYNTGMHRTGIPQWFSKNVYFAPGSYAAGDA